MGRPGEECDVVGLEWIPQAVTDRAGVEHGFELGQVAHGRHRAGLLGAHKVNPMAKLPSVIHVVEDLDHPANRAQRRRVENNSIGHSSYLPTTFPPRSPPRPHRRPIRCSSTAVDDPARGVGCEGGPVRPAAGVASIGIEHLVPETTGIGRFVCTQFVVGQRLGQHPPQLGFVFRIDQPTGIELVDVGPRSQSKERG